MNCTRHDSRRTYTASTGTASANASVTFSLTGAPYRGPGAVVFAGTVTVMAGSESISVRVAGPGTVNTDLSGTLSIDTSEVALDLSWTCG